MISESAKIDPRSRSRSSANLSKYQSIPVGRVLAQYEFVQLLAHAGRRKPAPLIEIHRVSYEGSGRGRQILDIRALERGFRAALAAPLAAAGLQASVSVWDDFHDRYLISNLVGISLPNGFDTTKDRKSVTTWTRLGRTERDDIQREFDVASKRHALRGRFTI